MRQRQGTKKCVLFEYGDVKLKIKTKRGNDECWMAIDGMRDVGKPMKVK